MPAPERDRWPEKCNAHATRDGRHRGGLASRPAVAMLPAMTQPALIFSSHNDDPVEWGNALKAVMPELDFRVYPDSGRVEDVVAALVWRHPHGALRAFPNLKLVVNLGAGVD